MRERDKEYGDRFVPNRDSGDMRTSYHLKDEGGPSTPSKNRLIPTESDALKGVSLSLSSSNQFRAVDRELN
jgi:cell division cycle 20-like protein 1 (cofactor of APC complex)